MQLELTNISIIVDAGIHEILILISIHAISITVDAISIKHS